MYSQRYLAYSIRIGGFWDGVKCRWNRLSQEFNRRFDRTIDRPAQCPLLIPGSIFPTFSLTIEDKLIYFLWALRHEGE